MKVWVALYVEDFTLVASQGVFSKPPTADDLRRHYYRGRTELRETHFKNNGEGVWSVWSTAKPISLMQVRVTENEVEGGEDFLDGISDRADLALRVLDNGFVGTPDYMGLACFWDRSYKEVLREASHQERRAVHRAFLQAGLPVLGVSPEHEALIAAHVHTKIAS